MKLLIIMDLTMDKWSDGWVRMCGKPNDEMSTTSLCIKVTNYVLSCTKRELFQMNVPLIYLIMTTTKTSSKDLELV